MMIPMPGFLSRKRTDAPALAAPGPALGQGQCAVQRFPLPASPSQSDSTFKVECVGPGPDRGGGYMTQSVALFY